MSLKKLTLLFIISVFTSFWTEAASDFITFEKGKGALAIIDNGAASALMVDANDDDAVKIAVITLSEDFGRVSGKNATVCNSLEENPQIVIGTIGTPAIDKILSKAEKKSLEGKNEKFLIKTKKINGKKRLVIAGSDRRGTVYGIYELSRQMGVSPWYWWADVPTTERDYVGILDGEYSDDEPAVEYRGIFINDEWPCFGNWTHEKFGGFNAKMHSQLFELILRLKGNYLWPAMWGSAFYDDDPENGHLANRMGIVMGTSHHEPLALAHQEWKRYGSGPWDFSKNAQVLCDFWRKGVKRAKDWETIYTIGMRGDGDEPMEDGTNVKLLENIVDCQRKIIEEETGRPSSELPQMWALYKEVQDYYDRGMEVPDDVTLLLCDDNWGNVRRLPELDAPERKGGYGMYYHFDYVGAPRNSKWMSINHIPRVWEQLNLTYSHGVKKLWIVNVGDLKLQEYPIQFFMDMAWSPENFNANNLKGHTMKFYSDAFGETAGREAADIMWKVWKQNRIVTPEQLCPSTFTFNYNEWPKMVSRMDNVAAQAEKLRAEIKPESIDAYDELVYIPSLMVANLYRLFYAAAMNQKTYNENNPQANLWADEVERLFNLDQKMTNDYHKIANGKWNHHMDQTHIGYTSWNEPKQNVMPEVHRLDSVGAKIPAISYPVNDDFEKSPISPYRFAETDQYVAIEAVHTSRRNESESSQWLEIPDFGKTLSGITTWPCTAKPDDMWIEYDFDMTSTGNVDVMLNFAPTLNYNGYRGHSYTVSIDGNAPQTVNINKDYRGELGQWQKDPVIASKTVHEIANAGSHTLRIQLNEPGMILERIIINAGGVKPSHLGAPETLAPAN